MTEGQWIMLRFFRHIILIVFMQHDAFVTHITACHVNGCG